MTRAYVPRVLQQALDFSHMLGLDGAPIACLCLQVMRAIGEQFPQANNVVGVALNIRKNGSRLALWTRATKTDAVEKTLGRDFKATVKVPTNKFVGYSSHDDSKVATANGKMYWSSFRGTIRV